MSATRLGFGSIVFCGGTPSRDLGAFPWDLEGSGAPPRAEGREREEEASAAGTDVWRDGTWGEGGGEAGRGSGTLGGGDETVG